MSSVIISGDTSGAITLAAPAVSGTNTATLPAATGNVVLDSATQTLTNKTIQGGAITSGTAQASTSGTSIDFTGIPSWVKRITVMFGGVSGSGTSPIQIQLGTSGGVQTTSYDSIAMWGTTSNTSTTGFITAYRGYAADLWSGAIVFTLLNSSTGIWVSQGVIGYGSNSEMSASSGTKTLSGTLDRVRITTVGGTDTFDAGTINILYE